MWVYPETFRLHLRILKRHFEPVRLGEWLRRAHAGEPLPPRACAITFDDGWKDNYEYAYPILREAAIPATLFLCSDMLDGAGVFWPEKLAALLQFLADPGRVRERERQQWLTGLCPALAGGRLDIDAIDDAIVRAKQRYSDPDVSMMIDTAIADVNLPENAFRQPLLDWQQVHEMSRSGLVDIGSHTRHHIRLSDAIGEDVLHDQIVGSKRALEDRTNRRVDLFCYPNGDVTERAQALVKAHYRGACSTRRGWHDAGADPFSIRRVGMHEGAAGDRAAFLSRIAAGM